MRERIGRRRTPDSRQTERAFRQCSGVDLFQVLEVAGDDPDHSGIIQDGDRLLQFWIHEQFLAG
jgi:hypothetical protein